MKILTLIIYLFNFLFDINNMVMRVVKNVMVKIKNIYIYKYIVVFIYKINKDMNHVSYTNVKNILW